MGRPTKIQKESLAICDELETLHENLKTVLAGYEARLAAEIAELRQKVAEAPQAGSSRRYLKDLDEIRTRLRKLQLKPAKGRRKDLRRIDRLVGELTALLDSW